MTNSVVLNISDEIFKTIARCFFATFTNLVEQETQLHESRKNIF